jgi:hypothetical protein
MIFRNCRSASSMPAAVQRRAISPELQRFTLRWVRRTISIIDSHGLVDSSVRLRLPLTPKRVRVSVPLPQRAGGTGKRPLELRGELPQLIERTGKVLLRPRSAQPLLHLRPLTLGQVVEHVALLVPHEPLDGAVAEDGADRLAQRLGAVDDEQDALLGIEAALDQVGEQRGRDGGVLGRAFPEPKRALLILGLAARPAAEHLYWMLGGTWALPATSDGRVEATTGVRVVAAIMIVLLVVAVLVVLARVGLWQQALVSERAIRIFAWVLPVFFLGEALAAFGRKAFSLGGTDHWEILRPSLARARTAGAGRGGLGQRVAALPPATPDAAVALNGGAWRLERGAAVDSVNVFAIRLRLSPLQLQGRAELNELLRSHRANPTIAKVGETPPEVRSADCKLRRPHVVV